MILILAHRHPYKFQPRGGEKSVRLIAEHLAQYFNVEVIYRAPLRETMISRGVVYRCVLRDDYISMAGVKCILTWGLAADEVLKLHKRHGTPYVLMVRWWRNVAPLPPGRLLEREQDGDFIASKQALFDDAEWVICNNNWSAGVVKSYYGVDPLVSYVPSEHNEPIGYGNPGGHVLVASARKDLGAEEIVPEIAKILPHEFFVMINSGQSSIAKNVAYTPYIEEMSDIFRETKLVIYPVYGNDVCGTSRIAVEAAARGIPTLANNRCGIGEKGMLTLPEQATAEEWAEHIKLISDDYQSFVDRTRQVFEEYDSKYQLKVYEEAVRGIVS